MNRFFVSAVTVAIAVWVTSAAYAKKDSQPAQMAEAPASKSTASSAMIMAYKRTPVPIYDNEGSKLREVPQASLPKAMTPGARVVGAKPGFVAIMIDGKPAWLRLTTVDFVGDLPAPKCDATSVKLAMMEEDGVQKSLGLGCGKPK
jgi:hypothetical protein